MTKETADNRNLTARSFKAVSLVLVFQLAAQIFGQIRALVPALCTPADPGEDLLFPERGQSQFF